MSATSSPLTRTTTRPSVGVTVIGCSAVGCRTGRWVITTSTPAGCPPFLRIAEWLRKELPPSRPTSPSNARPEALYSLITDLPTLAELAEETTAMRWTKGDSARPGAVFKGSNRNGRHSLDDDMHRHRGRARAAVRLGRPQRTCSRRALALRDRPRRGRLPGHREHVGPADRAGSAGSGSISPACPTGSRRTASTSR